MEYIVQIMFPVVAITVSILWLDSVILYFTCFGIIIISIIIVAAAVPVHCFSSWII